MALTSGLVLFREAVADAISSVVPTGNFSLVISTARALHSAGVGKDQLLAKIRASRMLRMLNVCMGEITVWDDTGEAVVYPFEYQKRNGNDRFRFGIPQMVGEHRSAFPFADAMRSRAERVTVNLRSLPKDDHPWRSAITAARNNANPPNQKLYLTVSGI